MEENKKLDKSEIIIFVIQFIISILFIVVSFILAQKVYPMIEQEQYRDFGYYCCFWGFSLTWCSILSFPTLGRTIAYIFKKVKNAAPKGEKGRKV